MISVILETYLHKGQIERSKGNLGMTVSYELLKTNW